MHQEPARFGSGVLSPPQEARRRRRSPQAWSEPQLLPGRDMEGARVGLVNVSTEAAMRSNAVALMLKIPEMNEAG